jgi:hypothetical protein
MFMFLLPKTTIKKMKKIRRRFFWQGGKLKKKYHLVRWNKVCKSKKKGGLGIKDLRKMNISLLYKWWWYLESSEGIWQDIVRLKYVKQFPIRLIPSRFNDFPLWKDLLKVRQVYLKGRDYIVKNGKSISFWLGMCGWIDSLTFLIEQISLQ